MRRITLTALFVLTYLLAICSSWTSISSREATPAKKILISSDIENSVIRFTLDGFSTTEVNTNLGKALVISLENATPLMKKGAPDLPKLTASLIIPDQASMGIEVISSSYKDFENILIAPSKGNLYRNTDPSTIPYEFGPEYKIDKFFPESLTDARDPYIVRDYRGETVILYPFRYNPLTRTLRVYYDVTVKLKKNNGVVINPIERRKAPDQINAQFSRIYQRHFLNATSSRYDALDEFGKMLIITYGDFSDAIQPFVDWKRQMGYPVEVVDVASIGNSTAIKNYIANYYNTKGLTFVLLVGDAPQVPSSSTSAGDSDNNYSYIVGNDHYPDLLIGRFSAENVDQVATQVQKTLMYEQNPPIDHDWYTLGTGIGSDQGPGDDGEYDYQHIRNIGLDLLSYTYTYCNELFDGSQGGNDAGGNPSPSQVAQAINDGTSIINYCGHGSDNSWGTSGFSSNDVNNLVNDNLLPFVFSVACVNGNFVNGTCFAEAWMRATHNGIPTGAIAFLGATINQSWDPPMAGQDEMDDILVETYPDNIKRTFAALSMNGCMLMNDEFGSAGVEMTDTWTVFGDPSVMVRTAFPETLSVIHDPVLFIGAEQLVITCPTEGARATLSLDGVQLGTAVVSGGMATISFAPLTAPGTVELTVTAFNSLPYIAGIDVIPADGPFIVMDSYTLNDEMGNNNGLADYNEEVKLNMYMKNVGIEDATDVSVTLLTSDPYISIIDNHEVYPLIPAGQSISIEDAFTIVVSVDIPDQHKVNFNLNSSNGDASWESMFVMNTNAPVLNINNLTINDQDNGNGNGILDPGEQAEMTINYSNTGHAVAYNVNVLMQAQSGFVDIANPEQYFSSMGFLGDFNKTFNITVDEEASEGILVNFVNQLTIGDLIQERIYPEKISPKIEDFETGDFTKFNWTLGGNQPWQIISEYPYEGNYSIRSGLISSGQSSDITMTYNVMTADSIIFYRKVSSEVNDKLKFYINNILMGEWSGTNGVWKRISFAVSAGQKTFKWVYVKNGSGSSGADCAWLDNIILPPPMATSLWAGPDDAVCDGAGFSLSNSYATEYTQLSWSTSGDGTFNDNSIMHPLYTPGSEDISNGQVNLSMDLISTLGDTFSDDMLLSVGEVPAAPATPQGPDYVNLAQVQTSDYTTEEVTGASTYNWYLEPAEAGTITGIGNMATVQWDPAFLGQAGISVAADNSCGEGGLSETFAVTVDYSVGISDAAGRDRSFKLYPNPARNILYLKSGEKLSGILGIRIYDILGNLLIEKNKLQLDAGSTASFDISNLPEGIYLVNIRSNESSSNLKLVVR